MKITESFGTILAYKVIKNGKIWHNGTLSFGLTESESLERLLIEGYYHLELNYPRYFKMDTLCKLGLLAASGLIGEEYQSYDPTERCILIANRSASNYTDSKYYATIQNKNGYFPSPSLFVYTLPSILIGELSIRYDVRGEGAFFVSDSFDIPFMYDCWTCFGLRKSSMICLLGWIDVNLENQYEAFLVLLKVPHRDVHGLDCSVGNLQELYYGL